VRFYSRVCSVSGHTSPRDSTSYNASSSEFEHYEPGSDPRLHRTTAWRGKLGEIEMAGSDASQQHPGWHAGGNTPGERWRLHKAGCGHYRQAVCELLTHERGWELRLVVDGNDLRNSRLLPADDDVLSVVEEWKTAMVERGWS
jgi:hypothetical protein